MTRVARDDSGDCPFRKFARSDGIEVNWLSVMVEFSRFVLSELLALSRNDRGDVYEGCVVFLFGYLHGPHPIVRCSALHVAIWQPLISWGERQYDRHCTQRLRVTDVLPEIPSIRVDSLMLLGEQVINLLRFIACTGDCASGARFVVDGEHIILSKLNQHNVATFDVRAYCIP